jgi:hypothetical protein
MSGISAPASSFTISSSTPGVANNGTSASWDTSGNILSWSIQVAAQLLGGGNFESITSFGSSGFHSENVRYDQSVGLGSNFARPGTWTAVGPATVPIPAVLPLLLTGLAGLGLISWRKKA